MSCARPSTRVLDSGRFILGPEVRGLRARVRRLLRVLPRRRRGQRHRRDHDRPAGDGGRPGRRGHRPLLHLLRLGRGDPADGARRRCSATSTPTPTASRRRRSRPCSPPARRPSSPCTCSGTSRPVAEIEQLGRAGARGRRPGGRRTWPGRPAGSAGNRRPRSPSSPPRTSARSETAASSPPPDADVAEAARTLRFHGSHDKVTYEMLGYNSRLDELQAALLRVELPHLDDWADGRRRAGAHYEQAGLGELVRLPARPRVRARLAPVRDRQPPGRPGPGRPRRRPEIGCRRLLPHARPPPGGDAQVGARGSSCRQPKLAARTHLAIPMSPVLSREQADEVVAAVQASGVQPRPSPPARRRRLAQGPPPRRPRRRRRLVALGVLGRSASSSASCTSCGRPFRSFRAWP